MTSAGRYRKQKKRNKNRIVKIIVIAFAFVAVFLWGVGKVSHFVASATSPLVTNWLTNGKSESLLNNGRNCEDADTANVKLASKGLPNNSKETIKCLKKKAKKDSRIQEILENKDHYPQKLLDSLASNSEMTQFIYDYLDKQSQICEENYDTKESTKTVPLYQQWDERWGYAPYGNSIIAIAGCGPTCLSMAVSYVTKDTSCNPLRMAKYSEQHGYLTENSDTLWALMTDGVSGLGLHSEELSLQEQTMIDQLDAGHPIICSMSAGDFTKNGHFIVVSGYQDGLFVVNDPNSKKRSKYGWSYDRLSTQIAAMWAISK